MTTEGGYWRCPVCRRRDGEHGVGCTVTDDGDLEWVEGTDDESGATDV